MGNLEEIHGRTKGGEGFWRFWSQGRWKYLKKMVKEKEVECKEKWGGKWHKTKGKCDKHGKTCPSAV